MALMSIMPPTFDSALSTKAPLRPTPLLLLLTSIASASASVAWTQTARHGDGTLVLLEDQEPLEMKPVSSKPSGPALVIDRSQKYQEFAGFGGAFTEAAAINWRKLSPEYQQKVIDMYFGAPEDGGLGYTLGRVPMGSCDFSPASYNFDDVEGDKTLAHFDMAVQHDVDVGMVDMIREASLKAKSRGQKLKVLASPWSPPAWMKLPVMGKRAMTLSAKPNGLDPEYAPSWAQYFSKFLSAYKSYGIDLWAVTVQNEPEATAGWEAMLWTPEYMASFVKTDLGPTLAADHPEVKIIGFDHNKDHVVEWTQGLYADPEAAKYFSGVGVHWYGGLNTDNLQAAHEIAPDKFLLATEACNCVGNVVYSSPNIASWWTRAEKLALDILEDLRFWCVGWIDWNLLVDTSGGPNHLKNLCDANIIVDADESLGTGSPLIQQASYYYMGHFSRYFLPGGKRLGLANTVETEIPPLAPADVKNGVALAFVPCDETNAVQAFRNGPFGGIVAVGTDTAPGSDGYSIGGECVEFCISGECWFPKVQLWACAGEPSAASDVKHGPSGNQQWELLPLKSGGVNLLNPGTGKCLTAITAEGWAVGLDAGVTVVAAQLYDCFGPKGGGAAANQTFFLDPIEGSDAAEASFLVRSALTEGPKGAGPMCLQPQLDKLPHFDAVAFENPDGEVAVVVMNTNDYEVPLTIYDEVAEAAFEHVVPPHAIHTYRWPTEATTAATALHAAAATADAAIATIATPAALASTAAAAPAAVEAAASVPVEPRDAAAESSSSAGADANAATTPTVAPTTPTPTKAAPEAAALEMVAAEMPRAAVPPSHPAWIGGGAILLAATAALVVATAGRVRLLWREATDEAAADADGEEYVAFAAARAPADRA